MWSTQSYSPTSNRLLSALPKKTFDTLLGESEILTYDRGNTLLNCGDVIDRCYFPLNGMISVLSVTNSGKSVEVGYIGFEGFVGFSLVLGADEMPYEALAQSRSSCVAVKASTILSLFESCEKFRQASLRYAFVMIRQLAQTCICNHFHTIESRVCRWMTVMSERSKNTNLMLTQEFLAMMLGVQRTSIGPVTSGMQRDGIIRYSRGLIEILDADRLRRQACECYSVVTAEHRKLLTDLNVL